MVSKDILKELYTGVVQSLGDPSEESFVHPIPDCVSWRKDRYLYPSLHSSNFVVASQLDLGIVWETLRAPIEPRKNSVIIQVRKSVGISGKPICEDPVVVIEGILQPWLQVSRSQFFFLESNGTTGVINRMWDWCGDKAHITAAFSDFYRLFEVPEKMWESAAEITQKHTHLPDTLLQQIKPPLTRPLLVRTPSQC